MREVALAAIGAYQRYVSPYKGFCCAYREHTGRASCSGLGARAIRRWGVWRGLAVLKLRLRRCGDIHRQCVPARPTRALATQRGECDPGCDLGLRSADGCCDVVDVCDCYGCDWPSRKSRAYKTDPRRKPDRARRWNAAERRWDESADANVDVGRRRDG